MNLLYDYLLLLQEIITGIPDTFEKGFYHDLAGLGSLQIDHPLGCRKGQFGRCSQFWPKEEIFTGQKLNHKLCWPDKVRHMPALDLEAEQVFTTSIVAVFNTCMRNLPTATYLNPHGISKGLVHAGGKQVLSGTQDGKEKDYRPGLEVDLDDF